MRNFIQALLVSSVIFSGNIFALTSGSYFQQEVTVDNSSTQSAMVSDPASTYLNNALVNVNYYLQLTFASDQLTNAAGQTFTHTVTIHSAVDYSVICTVQSNLFLSQDSTKLSKPTSSNAAKCQTSVYMKSSSNGMIYGFKIKLV